jgi:uncharacterized integral membrane protein
VRTIAKILLGIVILLVAVFAIANRGDITLSFSPLPFAFTMPVYAAILGAFAIGLVVGTALALIGRERMRLRARAGEHRARAAETKLAGEQPPPGAPLPAVPSRARLNDD